MYEITAVLAAKMKVSVYFRGNGELISTRGWNNKHFTGTNFAAQVVVAAAQIGHRGVIATGNAAERFALANLMGHAGGLLFFRRRVRL